MMATNVTLQSGVVADNVHQGKIEQYRCSYFPRFITASSLKSLSPNLVRVLITCSNLYSEDKIRFWAQKFQRDCSDGRATRLKLLAVFKHFYNEKKANLLLDNALNAFGCSTDRIDNIEKAIPAQDDGDRWFLDFSRFLLTVTMICQGNTDDKMHVASAIYLYNKEASDASSNETLGRPHGKNDGTTFKATFSRDDAVCLLESIAVLLGVKRFSSRTDNQDSASDMPYASPIRQRVDKIFNDLKTDELTEDTFVNQFCSDSLVKGLLATRF